MSVRFVLFASMFLAVVSVIDGCDTKSSKPGKHNGRKTRRVDTPIVVGESEIGLFLRPQDTKSVSMQTEAEEVFHRIDTNSDGVIDAAEWVDFAKESSVWDFVELLDHTDADGDEGVSLKELLSVEVVKIHQSEKEKEKKDDVGVTLS